MQTLKKALIVWGMFCASTGSLVAFFAAFPHVSGGVQAAFVTGVSLASFMILELALYEKKRTA